jgi:hypothetical protein
MLLQPSFIFFKKFQMCVTLKQHFGKEGASPITFLTT